MSGKALVARPLAPADQTAWDGLVARHGSIFDSARWTAMFGASLRRLGIYDAGNNLRGGFCIWEQRKFGLQVLRNPPYTPQIGPFWEPRATNPTARTEEQRAVVEAMADYLSAISAPVVALGISHGIIDLLPFSWRGWKVVPHYTYRIDLMQTESQLLTSMSVQQRNPINKARRDGIVVEEVLSTHELRALVMMTYARQRKAFSCSDMDDVFAAYPPGRGSYCLISRRDGCPIAGAFVIHDSRTAYNLITGYDDTRAHNGAGALSIWHAILKAKTMGLETFDFEGSVIPPIERYYRGFGGQLTPLWSVNKAWLPIEMALKTIPKYRDRF